MSGQHPVVGITCPNCGSMYAYGRKDEMECADCNFIWRQNSSKVTLGTIKAFGNLSTCSQVCFVNFFPRTDAYPPKAGIEINLVSEHNPIAKPRSLYFSVNEVAELDRLISALDEARKMLADAKPGKDAAKDNRSTI